MTHHVSRETFLSKCFRYTPKLMICAFVFSFISLVSTPAAASPKQSKPFVVAVSQIVEHVALDQVYQGFLSEMKNLGYAEDDNWIVMYRNAQGNVTTSSQIAYSLMAYDPKPDVFIAIGTPTAQSAIAAGRKNKIPVIFAAVTDPISSKLVTDLEEHRPLVTGVIDFPPILKQIDLMKTILPDLKKVGVLYNNGESNSESVIKAFKKAAKDQGIDVVDGIVSKSADLTLAFRRLYSQGVQAIYVPQDNTVISAAPRLAQLSYAMKLPVFTSDNGSVKQGALASRSYSYEAVGRKVAQYAHRIHKGEDAGKLPIQPPEKHALYLNLEAAEILEIEIPQELVDSAIIYKKEAS